MGGFLKKKTFSHKQKKKTTDDNIYNIEMNEWPFMQFGIGFVLSVSTIIILPQLSLQIGKHCCVKNKTQQQQQQHKAEFAIFIGLKSISTIVIPLVVSLWMSHG